MKKINLDFDFFITKFKIEDKNIILNFNGISNASWREAVFYHTYADFLALVIIEPILVDNLIQEIGEILIGNNTEIDVITFSVVEKNCSSGVLPSLNQMRDQRELVLRIYKELKKLE